MAISMSKALAVYLAAKRDLGNDLGGMSLVDLLADNFPYDSIADCKAVAKQLKQDVG